MKSLTYILKKALAIIFSITLVITSIPDQGLTALYLAPSSSKGLFTDTLFLDYLRRIYGREDAFKIRTRLDLQKVFVAVKKLPAIQPLIESKTHYYFPQNIPDKKRINQLYRKYVENYKKDEGKSATFSLYILLVIRQIKADEKMRPPFGKDVDISWQDFFVLLDIYLHADMSVIFHSLSNEISMFNRVAPEESAAQFKLVRDKKHLVELVLHEDRMLSLHGIRKKLKEDGVEKKFIKKLLTSMQKVGSSRTEKKRHLCLILALRRMNSKLSEKYQKSPDNWVSIIELLKGRRLEEAFDLYYTLFSAGNDCPDIIDALAFAYKTLDENVYDRAIQEAYRLNRLGINPYHFLRLFFPYTVKCFGSKALDTIIQAYEDTVLTSYKVIGKNYSGAATPENKACIFARKRNNDGSLVFDKKMKGREYDCLADFVSEDDFVYSLKLARELANLFIYSDKILPALTNVAKAVGRERYRETVEWLVDVLLSDENPIVDTFYMSEFISEVIPGIAVKLNPDNFKKNIQKVLKLIMKMKIKSFSKFYFILCSFETGAVKIYRDDEYFNMLMGLADDLLDHNRNPDCFLYYGVRSCYLHLRESDERNEKKILRLLYTIAMKSDPAKEYTYPAYKYGFSDLRGTLDALIFSNGIRHVTEYTAKGQKKPLIDGKKLIEILELVIQLIDSKEPPISIVQKLDIGLSTIYKYFSLDDIKIKDVLGLECNQMIKNLALDSSVSWEVRYEMAKVLGILYSSKRFFSPQINIERSIPDEIPSLSWEDFLNELGLPTDSKATLVDRMLIIDISEDEKIKIKFTRNTQESHTILHQEPQWLKALSIDEEIPGLKSNFVQPIEIRGSRVFRLSDKPVELRTDTIFNKGYAICEKVSKKDLYANDPKHVSSEDFIKSLRISSYDLGKLASYGIFHASLIPLFHNREENRRYEWWQRGRLDSWLHSCDFPNVGTCGLRSDLEHLTQSNNIIFTDFMQQVVTELLSLSLISGSYFRNKDRTRVGSIAFGKPHNTRDLFDRDIFKKALTTIFSSYYEGLIGENLPVLPIELDSLCNRMIDEFSVDRYMRGREGPDLGELNNVFSLPELLDSLEYTGILFSTALYEKLQTKVKIADIDSGSDAVTEKVNVLSATANSVIASSQ